MKVYPYKEAMGVHGEGLFVRYSKKEHPTPFGFYSTKFLKYFENGKPYQ